MSTNDLFNHMIYETNNNTDWTAELSWSEEEEVLSFPSETTGSTYVSGLSHSQFRRLLQSLTTKHNLIRRDRRKILSLTDSTRNSEFMDVWFGRKDGGIGWCRVGFVGNRHETDHVDVAYNCVSYPIPQDDLPTTAERLLKLRVHEAIGKFDRLYRNIMT